MKKVFWEYYHPDKKDLKKMKKEAIFTFDACSLLKLYSYKNTKRNQVIELMNKLVVKQRVWLPHQFCLEFHKNRLARVIQEFEEYDKLNEKLEDFKESKLKGILSNQNHLKINTIKIREKIETNINFQKKEIEKAKKKHPDWRDYRNDLVCKKIQKIFSKENIGSEYKDEKLKEIQKKIRERTDLKMQPGLSDLKDKTENGDTIAWLQILDYAEKNKKSIILVTEETKNDFWEEKKRNDKAIPRRSLVREFYDASGKMFFILNMKEFERFIMERNYFPIFGVEETEDQREKIVGSSVVGKSIDGNDEKLTNNPL